MNERPMTTVSAAPHLAPKRLEQPRPLLVRGGAITVAVHVVGRHTDSCLSAPGVHRAEHPLRHRQRRRHDAHHETRNRRRRLGHRLPSPARSPLRNDGPSNRQTVTDPTSTSRSRSRSRWFAACSVAPCASPFVVMMVSIPPRSFSTRYRFTSSSGVPRSAPRSSMTKLATPWYAATTASHPLSAYPAPIPPTTS